MLCKISGIWKDNTGIIFNPPIFLLTYIYDLNKLGWNATKIKGETKYKAKLWWLTLLHIKKLMWLILKCKRNMILCDRKMKLWSNLFLYKAIAQLVEELMFNEASPKQKETLFLRLYPWFPICNVLCRFTIRTICLKINLLKKLLMINMILENTSCKKGRFRYLCISLRMGGIVNKTICWSKKFHWLMNKGVAWVGMLAIWEHS